jgi:hypothetical protein
VVLVSAGYLKDGLVEEGFERAAPFALAPFRHVLGHPPAQPELGVRLR